jgi:hypothetical protein
MLQLTILLGPEQWDEKNEIFIEPKKQVLQLEHSLVSISKWESKWCKPFLSKEVMTVEETIDYIRCMTLTQNVNPDVYNYISNENIRQVNQYIEAPMTATWFTEEKTGKHNNEQVTNELIYYWMTALNIPFECQKWHFNRLITLIRVCNIKNQPPKKMSKKDLMSRNAALNAARRKQLNTKG